MKRISTLFNTMKSSLTRTDEFSESSGAEPSSELTWCLRSLYRTAESSEFRGQKEMECDTQALSLQLDNIIATLRNLIAEENNAL